MKRAAAVVEHDMQESMRTDQDLETVANDFTTEPVALQLMCADSTSNERQHLMNDHATISPIAMHTPAPSFARFKLAAPHHLPARVPIRREVRPQPYVQGMLRMQEPLAKAQKMFPTWQEPITCMQEAMEVPQYQEQHCRQQEPICRLEPSECMHEQIAVSQSHLGHKTTAFRHEPSTFAREPVSLRGA